VTYRYQAVKTTAPTDPDDGGSSDSDGDTINPGPSTSTKPTTSTSAVDTSATPMKSTAAQILKAPASSGRLPQSNERRSSWLIVIGLGLLAGLGVVVWRVHRQS